MASWYCRRHCAASISTFLRTSRSFSNSCNALSRSVVSTACQNICSVIVKLFAFENGRKYDFEVTAHLSLSFQEILHYFIYLIFYSIPIPHIPISFCSIQKHLGYKPPFKHMASLPSVIWHTELWCLVSWLYSYTGDIYHPDPSTIFQCNWK